MSRRLNPLASRRGVPLSPPRTPAYSDGNFEIRTHVTEPFNMTLFSQNKVDERAASMDVNSDPNSTDAELIRVARAKAEAVQRMAAKAEADAVKRDEEAVLHRAVFVAVVDETGRRRAILGQSARKRPVVESDGRVQLLSWLNVESGRVTPVPRNPSNTDAPLPLQALLACLRKCTAIAP